MNVDRNKLPLFGNLSRFRNKTVTVVLNNGVKINGILKSYDDASNLILESDGKRVLCLGRCLSLISLGKAVIL
jgi:sRNA-binding regulator protein Hfq